jgi:hypothetical protein
MEFDGGMFREEAEIKVLEEIRDMRVKAQIAKANAGKITN